MRAGPPEIEAIIDSERDHSRYRPQQVEVFGAIGDPDTTGDPERAQPPVWRSQGNTSD